MRQRGRTSVRPPSPVMVRHLRLLFILACIGVALAPGGKAHAHATLTKAVPADGSVVAAAPSEFSLGFSEPVSPLVLTLLGPDGTKRTLDRFTLADRTLTIAAPAGLQAGTHVLSWRVVSEDGHPVGGSVVFSIGAPSAAAPAIRQGDPAARALLWLGRLGLSLGLALGIGGVAFAAWVVPLPTGARRPIAIFLLTGLAALPVALAAQGLDALDRPLAEALQPAVWQAAMAGSFGRTGLIAAVALLAGLAALRPGGVTGRAFGAFALLGAGAALAASGHAGAAAPQWLTRPAVFLHAAGLCAWAGALLPLAFALREPAGTEALRRFSERIPLVLLVILASGLFLMVVQVERPGALLGTEYGRVLIAKLALVALLLGLAGFNRYRLTAEAGHAAAARLLRRVVAVEVAVVLAILGTAALWRFTPPPRTLALAAAQPVAVHIHTEKAMADVSLAPGRAGPVTIAVSLLDGEFGPLPAQELRLSLANPDAGIEPIERTAVRQDDGSWRVETTLPAAGRWTVELEILVSDFEMIRLGETVAIRP
jgi:copper transport protein